MTKLAAPNYTQLPNALIALIPVMGEAEAKIAIIIARETFGWHRPKAKLSIFDLMTLTGLTKQGVINGTKAGIGRGIIGRERDGQGFLYFLIVGDEHEDQLPDQVVNEIDQPTEATSQRSRPVLVNEVDRQLVNVVDPHEDKEKGLKKIKETHTQQSAVAPVLAGGGSRFSLQECRSYAGNLKATGGGITNPGGYATVIFRSGEADALIEKFLNAARAPDVKECPDCRGMGVYYPLGIGNGSVAKCKHEKLMQTADGATV